MYILRILDEDKSIVADIITENSDDAIVVDSDVAEGITQWYKAYRLEVWIEKNRPNYTIISKEIKTSSLIDWVIKNNIDTDKLEKLNR